MAQWLGRFLWLSGRDVQVELSREDVERARQRLFQPSDDLVVSSLVLSRPHVLNARETAPWVPSRLTALGSVKTTAHEETGTRRQVLSWNGSDLVVVQQLGEDVTLEGPVPLLTWLSMEVADVRADLRSRWSKGDEAAGERLRGELNAPAATFVLSATVSAERVVHGKFGEGTVLARDGNKVEVRFDDGAVRKLIADVVSAAAEAERR